MTLSSELGRTATTGDDPAGPPALSYLVGKTTNGVQFEPVSAGNARSSLDLRPGSPGDGK
jgi:hypothetical protein